MTWVPTAIIGALIVGLLATMGVLLSQGLGQPAPKPSRGEQVTELNWSSFSPAGLEYIARTREVRIDLSRHPVLAEPLGLEPNGTLVLEPIDNLDTVLYYSLIINGGGEGRGGDRFSVSHITIETRDGVVTRVAAPLVDVVTFRQAVSLLEGKAELFGWDTSHVPDIFAMVNEATRAGEPYEFTFGPADRVGVPIAATASCGTNGMCVIEYEALPPTQ